MKRYISILSLLIVAFGVNTTIASECIDEDCEIDDGIVVEEIVEEPDVLEPVEPTDNFWIDDEFSYDISSDEDMCIDDLSANDYNCPFDTAAECNVWFTKPAHKASVAPRAPHLSPVKIDGILATLTFTGTIDANDELAKPLLERYQILMRASQACCTEGIIHRMRSEKESDSDIYGFLKEDANRYSVTSRCMVMQNNDIKNGYSYGISGRTVATVRNSCLCKNRQWVDSLLEPFFDLYQLAPGFQNIPFYYTYLDSFQRETTVSVNADVQTVMELLQYCPD